VRGDPWICCVVEQPTAQAGQKPSLQYGVEEAADRLWLEVHDPWVLLSQVVDPRALGGGSLRVCT
jgi:hypothetical protein